jgi:AcrR family transcriptional regulator
MGSHTVDWTALRFASTESPEATGLRERRKRATRQQLIDTATELCLERGFDAVTVVQIAKVCGVSPTTVFNYFPTKESLILDVPEELLDALRTALADASTAPIEAMLRILAGELNNLVSWLDAQHDKAQAAAAVQRFEAMVRDTPSLNAHYRDMLHRMSIAAGEALAHRTDADPQAPEPQIAATALLGLWPIQVNASCRLLDGIRTPEQLRKAVTAEVHRAAELLQAGLSTFDGRLSAGRK